MTSDFVAGERERAIAWKTRTPTLPEEARAPAPYMSDGVPVGMFPFCLPPEFAAFNLLPAIRATALKYFSRESIAWHQQTPCGPTNHLLSSQVQCVNALLAIADDVDRIRSAFGRVLDISEILEVEPGRRVAFEYIGAKDYLAEVSDGRRRWRGSHTTSADGAIRYRSSDGKVVICLIEWKYTEDYRGHELSADPARLRMQRHEAAWRDPAGPLRTDVVPYDDLFVEPFYQLLRQQLLAWRMEQAAELGAQKVRVLHVSPRGNVGLRTSLNRPSHHEAGSDVFEIWRSLLREPDSFATLDSSVFADAALTSPDYFDRYE